MSSKVLVLWGVIVVGLVLSIFIYGSVNKDALLLSSKFDSTIKEAVNKYMEEEKKEIPLNIDSDTLIEKEYLEELVDGNKVCKAKINITKKLIFKNYDIKYTCEIKQAIDEN